MKTTETLLVVLLASLLLSACGQKGPLYFPDQQPVASTQADDSESDGEDKEEENGAKE